MRTTASLPRLHVRLCLLALLVLFGCIHSTNAQNRVVKLSVSVVDSKKQDVPGATVTISGGSGSPITVQSDASGTANAEIPVGAGGWLSSDPMLTIQANKDGSNGTETLNVRSKAFGSGNSIEMACTVVLQPPAAELTSTDTVKLIVNVVDVSGKAVSGATVSVTRDTWGPDMRPFDARVETDGNGVATINLSLGSASWMEGRVYWPVVDVEATKGAMTGKSRVKIVGKRLATGMRYPTEVPSKVIVRTRGINVAVSVIGDDKKEVSGASVLIRDSGAGGMGGERYRGTTGSDGKVTIYVDYSLPKDYTIEATKEGYDRGKAGLPLRDDQIGKAIEASVEMKKGPKSESVEVTVSVTKEGTSLGVGDVAVKFTGVSGSATGVYTTTTNGDGKGMVQIPGYGTFDVTLTQDTFEPLQKQVQLPYGEEQKQFDFVMTEKPTGDETVTITVFAGDVKNGRGGFQPLRGATVKAGKLSVGTDANGQVTLNAKAGIIESAKGEGYVEAVNVTVSAEGYKSQSRMVSIKRRGKNMAGAGGTSFTLEPGEDPVSDQTPLKLVVEVRDSAGPIKDASVDFHLPDDTWLFSFGTKAGGKVDFLSSDGVAGQQEVSSLRKGIRVKVQKKGYKNHESLVSADLLKPAKENRYTVELEKDWSELEKALTEIEGRVGAMRSEIRSQATKGQSVKTVAAKSIAARGRVESWLNELKAARKAFDTKLSGTKCEEAKELVKSIEALQREAVEKEQSLRKLIDEATGLAAICKTKAEGAVVAEKHRNAIKLAGEMGGIAPKATQANEKLKRFAEAMKDAGPLQTKLQETATNIQNELETAKKESATALSDFNDAFSTNLNVPGKRAALASDYAKLKAAHKLTKDYSQLPKDLAKRLESLDQVLGEGGADMSLTSAPPDLTRVDEVIRPALAQIEKSKSEADGIVAEFKGVMCTVQPMDAIVQELNSLTTGNTIELAAVADLPARAQACGTAPLPSPTPSDDVIVPDVSGFDDPGAMKAAAGPDMIGVITATKNTPPTGSTKLFAYQDPPAGSKAKRGSTLKIFIYQSLATVNTPTPTPSPSDEITVPDVSGFDDPGAMKAAAGPDMVGVIMATKNSPPTGTSRLFAYQDPPAGSKAKRMSTLKIYIYQSLATASSSPSPAPAVATTGMPDLIGLTLDQAVTRLSPNMRIGSDEIGDKPPTPEQALTIFAQTPAPGTTFDPKHPPVVTVKRYGSAKADPPEQERFDGTYVGSYSGSDSGNVRFTVTGGTIAITSPGSGTGQITSSGSASISGAGADGASSYTFSGTFSVDAKGRAAAGGRWTGTQSGFTGRGTWSAARR